MQRNYDLKMNQKIVSTRLFSRTFFSNQNSNKTKRDLTFQIVDIIA